MEHNWHPRRLVPQSSRGFPGPIGIRVALDNLIIFLQSSVES